MLAGDEWDFSRCLFFSPELRNISSNDLDENRIDSGFDSKVKNRPSSIVSFLSTRDNLSSRTTKGLELGSVEQYVNSDSVQHAHSI